MSSLSTRFNVSRPFKNFEVSKRIKQPEALSRQLIWRAYYNTDVHSLNILRFFLAFQVFTGSIARSARRRCLIYSEADFEVFLPARATRCTDGGEIWHGGGDRKIYQRVPNLVCYSQISPLRCNG